MTERTRFFRIYLRHTALANAFWRSFECELFAGERMARPVLDVGCGNGFFAGIILPGGVDTGIDIDEGEVRRARRSGVYRNVIEGSAARMPLPSGRFGTVFSNCVLEHIPDIDGTLREISRVLRKGGRLMITLPSDRFERDLRVRRFLDSAGLPALGRLYVSLINRVFKHVHVDGPGPWLRRLKDAGFRVERCEYFMPTRALKTYEMLLPLSLPSKFIRMATGRWILFPWARFWLIPWATRLFRGVLEAGGERGAGLYIRARKVRAPVRSRP